MSNQTQITLTEVVFTFEDIAKLNLQIGEIPQKYAVGLLEVINTVIRRNGEEKIKQDQEAKTKLVSLEDKSPGL
jgi:hypothetical protein